MGVAAAVIGLVGSAISAYGQYQQGKAQEEQMRRQAGLDMKRAAIEKYKRDLETAMLLKEQRARFAKSGVRIGTGSPAVVMSETAKNRAFDAEAIKWQVGAQTNELLRQGRSASKAGKTAAAGSLLSGLGSTLGR